MLQNFIFFQNSSHCDPKSQEKGIYNLGLAPVKLNGKWGFVSVLVSKMIIEPISDFVFCPKYESFAIVGQGDKWGWINSCNDKFDKYKNKVNMFIYDCFEDCLTK